MIAKTIEKQTSLFDKVGEEAKPKKKVTRKKKVEEPTELMKIVASKMQPKPKKIEEPDEKRKERLLLKEKYRKIKQFVVELEQNNRSYLVFFPVVTDKEGKWYRAIELSALYYAYRLAPRMGRKARVMTDSDNFCKARYAISLCNIGGFAEQMERLENLKPEITDDGIYIFQLKNTLSDDEIGGLWRTEHIRREKLHNTIRPAAMDPKIYNMILMISRQLMPKLSKMEKNFQYILIQEMMCDLRELMAVYFDYTNKLMTDKEIGTKSLELVNRLASGLSLYAENRIIGYETSTAIGANLNELKGLLKEKFFKNG